MTDYADLRWHGPEDAVAGALAGLPDPMVQVGPIALDGTAYVLRREARPRSVPEGLQRTGIQLSTAILGVIAGAPEDEDGSP
ncbi:hypothetical protein [Roseomonas indoligenes]|uniref:Uncharacterized protein n=1 Tax=Roseomonas indoligenes TaxID=2820811 RepID=A0A940S4C4_9PROT|nr:hypothetical protein [Pararoseomonas indoligenes]MBP0491834.1 hypothetical protein [Pararoseomonas indoligenes]